MSAGSRPVSSGECVAPLSLERASVERRTHAQDVEVDGSPLDTGLYDVRRALAVERELLVSEGIDPAWPGLEEGPFS